MIIEVTGTVNYGIPSSVSSSWLINLILSSRIGGKNAFWIEPEDVKIIEQGIPENLDENIGKEITIVGLFKVDNKGYKDYYGAYLKNGWINTYLKDWQTTYWIKENSVARIKGKLEKHEQDNDQSHYTHYLLVKVTSIDILVGKPKECKLKIISPTTSSPAIVGDPNNPVEFNAQVSTGIPMLLILPGAFSAKVGNKPAAVAVIPSFFDNLNGIYTLQITPPTQVTEGSYDLTIGFNLDEISDDDTEPNAVIYSTGGNIDVIEVIDRSGSMSGEKIQAAKDSAKLFADLITINDAIGVVSFSSSASVNYGLTTITADAIKQDAKDTIDAISATGGTSIGAGLRAAYNELVNKGYPPHPWAIVLMSDGRQTRDPHPDDVLPDIRNANIKVFTIGLGSDADASLLSRIAHDSGGGGGDYYYSPSSEGLRAIYNAIAGAIKAESTVKTVTGSIQKGETITHGVDVDPTINIATFTLTWTSGTLNLELVRPNGLKVNPGDSDVLSHIKGTTYETYTISNPIGGKWTMIITAASISSCNIEPAEDNSTVFKALSSKNETNVMADNWSTEISVPSLSSFNNIRVAQTGISYTAAVTGTTSLTVHMYTDRDKYSLNEPIKIITTLTKAGSPITMAGVNAIIESPDGTKGSLLLYDDGEHDDGVALDGIYANYYTATDVSGSHTITIHASGAVGTEEFTREVMKSVYVSAISTMEISVTPTSWDIETICLGDDTISVFSVSSTSIVKETVMVSATDLTDGYGNIMASENVISMPSTFVVPAGGSSVFYERIYVPEDAKPGNYTGSIVITSTANSVSIPVTLSVIEPSKPSPNLLKNPDFEDQLLYWSDTKDSAIYTASDQEPHGGFYCAKGVEVNNGNLGRLYQDVTGLVNAGNKYKIGGWIKTEDVVGNVVIALNYVDENGWCPAGGYVKEIGHVTGTTDWTYYESEWFILPPMPEDGVAAWFLFDFNNGRGTAYWDDVSLISSQQETGLVAEWRFDEGSGNIVKDSSGNGNDGIVHGATFVDGVSGYALNFDGIDDYVNVEHNEIFNATDQITIEAWINWNPGASGIDLIVDKGGLVYWFIIDSGDAISMCFMDDIENTIYGTGVHFIQYQGKWVHAVGSYDGTDIRLYLNGELVSHYEHKGRITTDNLPLRIGANKNSQDNFEGKIDEVRMYNRALSADEILERYNNHRPLYPVQEKITNNEVDDSDPTIVQISNGDILVAYTNWLNGAQIYLTRSSDNGLTWSTPVAITNQYHNIDPYITHTSDGKVWIVWTGSWVPGDFDNYYVTSDDNGQTWSEIKHIPTPEDWGTHTTIAEDSNHNVWIMWGDHYVISDDFREHWSQINQMPSWNGNNPSLFCDANGRLWIVTWSGGDIRYKISDDNGQTWSPYTVVVDELSQDEAIVIPEITQFVDGTIWITYHSNINGNREVYYTSSSDNGNTWSNPVQITDNSSQDWMPAIASINDVEIWVTWDSNRDGDRDIYLTKFLII